MKRTKKFVSLLLAILMIAGMLPTAIRCYHLIRFIAPTVESRYCEKRRAIKKILQKEEK